MSAELGLRVAETAHTGLAPAELIGGLATRELSPAAPPDISGILEAAEFSKGLVDPTPLEELNFATQATGNRVLVKREDLSPVGSFKWRGALNFVRKLPERARRLGLRAISAGNAAQGDAMAAFLYDVDLEVGMPHTAPDEKETGTRSWGATVVRLGDNYSEAVELAKEHYAGDLRTDIPSYDHKDVIDGQGTAGLEILEQCPEATHIFVPGGGGGYAAGILKAVKATRPEVKVIIVEPEDSNAIQLGYVAGRPVPLPKPPSIYADGVAVKQVGEVTLPYILAHADGVITVSKDQMASAVTSFFTEKKRVLEPSGALSMAGADKYAALTGCEGQTFVTLASGSDISAGKAGEILRRGEELTGHEALFSIQIPEKPGSLHRLTGGVIGRQRNITELKYSRGDPETAVIQVGFSMQDADDRHHFAWQAREQSYVSVDRTGDQDFKDYERGIVRRSLEPFDELSYVIDLPERAGALVDLLDALGDSWDISEIMYETHRSETGSPRISFATTEREQLEASLQQTGCSFRAVQSSRR